MSPVREPTVSALPPTGSGMPAGMVPRQQIINEAGTLTQKELLPTQAVSGDYTLGNGDVLEDVHLVGPLRILAYGDDIVIRNCWIEDTGTGGNATILSSDGAAEPRYRGPTIEHCWIEQTVYQADSRALLHWNMNHSVTVQYCVLKSRNTDIAKMCWGRGGTGFSQRWAQRLIFSHNYCWHEREPGSSFHQDFCQGNGDSYFQITHNVFDGDWLRGTNSCDIFQGEPSTSDIGNYEFAYNWCRGGKNLGEPANPYTQAGDYHIVHLDGYQMGAWIHDNCFEVDASDTSGNYGYYQYGVYFSQIGKLTTADQVYFAGNTYYDPTTGKFGQDVIDDDAGPGDLKWSTLTPPFPTTQGPGFAYIGPPPQLPPVDSRTLYVPPWA